MSDIRIERAAGPTDAVRTLVAELDEELARQYLPEQRHGLNLDALFQPHIRFFVAALNGQPAGCGGVALFADFAELKRMYVRPSDRGQGVADALLARLTEEAHAEGRMLLRLETGTLQAAAIRFYARAGFTPCGAFPPYSAMPAETIATSYFMEKRL